MVPTNAGLLFFRSHPQEDILQSDVACVFFRETVGASRYADRRILTGTLQELIDGAEVSLNRYIAVGAKDVVPALRDLLLQRSRVLSTTSAAF